MNQGFVTCSELSHELGTSRMRARVGKRAAGSWMQIQGGRRNNRGTAQERIFQEDERSMKGKDVHTTELGGFRQYLFVPAVIVWVCLLASVSAIAQITTADVVGTVTDS